VEAAAAGVFLHFQRILGFIQRISYENRIRSDKIMGVETPIPPIMIFAATPGRKPPRRIND
jgi:hypothetical protein